MRPAHHVLKGRPRHGPSVQVLFQESGARGEIAVVELIRDAPPQGTKLSPILEVLAANDKDEIRHDQQKETLLARV